jgi:EAL domain-containing protein (putative c-di-GMP-specific phosphodiesterase class I)
LQEEAELRRAIEREEFVLHYQPIVSLANDAIGGVEALVRWQHPTRGVIGPAEFIPLAEETGLIVPLGEWVLRTACAQTKAWHDAGLASLVVAVNLSAHQFRSTCVLTMVADILAETRLAPQYLTLELTESSVMEQAEATIRLLGALHALGVQLALDDFGTGYSSLSYLKHLPLTAIKLDRSFVQEITTNPHDAAIATAIIALAHTLNLHVTAEGIETEDQLHFFQAQHADAVQGYLCGRPLPAARLTQCLHDQCNV